MGVTAGAPIDDIAKQIGHLVLQVLALQSEVKRLKDALIVVDKPKEKEDG